jgi:predicted metal-dependent HD superfamily phosphohydrolase
MLFTLFYHDLFYNALKSDNEEQSALIAEKRMKQICAPQEAIDDCKRQILATKAHLDDSDKDTNLFTDADLSILGHDWETYSGYYKSVRKEYSLYPDLIYNPGRKKVLKHFLNMGRIYKTDYFYLRFEEQAKGNLLREMEMLKTGQMHKNQVA